MVEIGAPQESKSKKESICSDLKLIIERGGLRFEEILKQEVSTDELVTIESGRLTGEICQVVEQYVEFDNKGRSPDLINELEGLTEEVIDKKELKAIRKMSSEVVKGIKQQNKKRLILADEYSTSRVSADKLTFALMMLADMQKDKVTLLPEQIEKIEANRREKADKQLEETRVALTQDRRPLKENLENKVISVGSAGLRIVGILLALGIVYLSVAERDLLEKAWAGAQNLVAEIRPFGIHIDSAIEAERQDRYEQFLNTDETHPTIAKVLRSGQWPDDTAEDIIRYLDPSENNYNQWMAFIEWCGPECLLDPDWIPAGKGQEEVADLLGLTDTEYQNYQKYPEKWSDLVAHLHVVYPDKPWLADLFSITPTLIDSNEKSPFELWLEKYQSESLVDQGIAVSMLGMPLIRNRWGVVEQRLDRRQPKFSKTNVKGHGFGSSKGFS